MRKNKQAGWVEIRRNHWVRLSDALMSHWNSLCSAEMYTQLPICSEPERRACTKAIAYHQEELRKAGVPV